MILLLKSKMEFFEWLGSKSTENAVRFCGDISDIERDWMCSGNNRLIVLDGQVMRDWDEFYDAMFEGMGLPADHGRNLNALSESLSEGDVLQCEAIVIAVLHANCLLVDSPFGALDALIDTFELVAAELLEPVSIGSEWDRDAILFRVLFFDSEGDSRFGALPTVQYLNC